MDKIIEKLKDNLSEADLKDFKQEFEKLVESRALEYAGEREKILQKAAEKMIAEQVAENKSMLAEQFKKERDQELTEIEEMLTETVSECIKEALKEAVSDDMLQKIALAEMYQPIIEGTQQLFENHLVKLSPSSSKQIKKLEEQVEKLEQKLDESYERNFEHERDKEALKRAVLIESAKLDLKPHQAKELETICEGVSFDVLEKNMGRYVKHIMESAVSDPRDYLSEKDLSMMQQKKRWPGKPLAQGDLDETEQIPGDAQPETSTINPGAKKATRKRLVFQ